MTFLVFLSPFDFELISVLPADSGYSGVGVSIHCFTDKKRFGWEGSPPILVVDFYFVGGVTFIFLILIIVVLSVYEDVGYSAETGVFKSVGPKTAASQDSAHILFVFESVFVVWLVIGREYVM